MKCQMIEIGYTDYTPTYYKILSEIEEVSTEGETFLSVDFEFKTKIIDYYTDRLVKSSPYTWLYS